MNQVMTLMAHCLNGPPERTLVTVAFPADCRVTVTGAQMLACCRAPKHPSLYFISAALWPVPHNVVKCVRWKIIERHAVINIWIRECCCWQGLQNQAPYNIFAVCHGTEKQMEWPKATAINNNMMCGQWWIRTRHLNALLQCIGI